MSYFDDLVRSIQKVVITDYPQPQDPVKLNDKVLGILSDQAKRMYILWNQAILDHNAKTIELRILERKKKIIEVLFWQTVLSEFNSWEGNEAIAIRENWQVVSFKDESPPSSFIDLLKSME